MYQIQQYHLQMRSFPQTFMHGLGSCMDKVSSMFVCHNNYVSVLLSVFVQLRKHRQHCQHCQSYKSTLHSYEFTADLLTKKIAFDRVMLLRRLKEEELIVLKEVKQHWESLKRESENVQDLASHVALELNRQGRCTFMEKYN